MVLKLINKFLVIGSLTVMSTLLMIAGVGAQELPAKVTLKDCIYVTLKHHPSSTIYMNTVAIAKEKIRESRSAFLPTVTANANLDYNIKLQTSVIPAGSFSSTETQLQMGNKFSSGASAQADLNILDRTSRYTVQSAKVDKEVADLNVLKENETLVYNTASAYYQVLGYIEKGKLLRENENQYKQLLNILKLRYEQGVAKKSEYDRTRVNLSNIQAELSLNENNYQLALNKLKNAMGVDLQRSITINDSIDYGSAQMTMPSLEDLNTPELLSYRIEEKNLLLKEIDIKKKQAAFLPTLSLYGKYGANAYGAELSNAFTQWFDYSAIGVKLSVPIFSGFKKSSQLTQSRIGLENQRLTFKLNNENYKLEYQNSGSQLLSSYTSLLKNKENLKLAKEVLEATTVEYKEGTADLSTFMDADSSYKEAQSNYTTSLLDFLNSQLAFEKYRGTLTGYINNLK